MPLETGLRIADRRGRVMVAETGPRVGVVVAAYNAGPYVAESLRSIQAQTVVDWQCVVVDDGSGDDTAAVVQEIAAADPRVTLVRQENLGTPIARNNGLAALAPGVEFVGFLDADDVWLPDALEVLVATLGAHPDAVGAYGLAEYSDAQGRPVAPGRHPAGQRARRRMGRFDLVDLAPSEPYTFDALIVSGTMWPTAVALHRLDVVRRVGGFDAALRQVQDWDLYLRMSRSGPFVPVDRQVAWYRQHATNVTHRSERVAYYSLAVRRKAFESGEDTPAQHTASRRVWRRLGTRWTVWTVQTAVRQLRHGHAAESATAMRSAARFVPSLINGRPPEPDLQMSDAISRYVSERAFSATPSG